MRGHAREETRETHHLSLASRSASTRARLAMDRRHRAAVTDDVLKRNNHSAEQLMLFAGFPTSQRKGKHEYK